MDYFLAVDRLNDITEHRFGSGPLEDRDADGDRLRRKAYRLAVKTNAGNRFGWADDLATIKVVLGL